VGITSRDYNGNCGEELGGGGGEGRGGEKTPQPGGFFSPDLPKKKKTPPHSQKL